MGSLVAVKHGTGATLPQGHPLRAALGLDVEREIWGWHISRSRGAPPSDRTGRGMCVVVCIEMLNLEPQACLLPGS